MSTPPGKPNPPAFVAEAQRLVEQGKAREALALLGRVLDRHPDAPAALYAAGTILVDLGVSDRAMEVADRLRRVAPDAPASHMLAARAEESGRRLDEAARSLERAHELRPTDPSAAALRARLAERCNDLATARQWTDKALTIDPTHPLARLLDAKVWMRQDSPETAAGVLRQLVGDPKAMRRLPPLMRAAAYHDLGHALDRLGDYVGAWAAFEQSSRERDNDPAWKAIDAERAFARVANARGVLTPGFLDACPKPDASAPVDTVFLVGLPRSGTTLTESIIEAHPRVVGTDELSPLAGVVADLRQRHADAYPGCLATIGDDEVARLRELYRNERARLLGERANAPGAVVLDKLPLNLVELPLIARVFPDAGLIVALRDPRDACLSNTMQFMGANPSMKALSEIEPAARFAAALLGLWLDARPHLGMKWVESRYRDLVDDTEKAARDLIAFCGLEWDPVVLDRGARSSRVIATPSYEAVTQRITDRAVGRWQNYAPVIGKSRWKAIEETLAPVLDALGYERD